MSDILQEICAAKRDEVAGRKRTAPHGELVARANDAAPVRGFAANLKATQASGGYGLIAEIKKASPSKGLIREDFQPAALAAAYETGGASCLSVLTDTPYFQGSDAYLGEARDVCRLPALRKDFMVDAYQIAESRILGADCILLILAVLADDEAARLRAEARKWQMDVLAEVHNEGELERALALQPDLIGVNNRDLRDFNVDLGTTERLAPQVPDGIVVVSESGLGTPGDLARMAAAGVRCFLIGESLMRQSDVTAATQALLANAAVPQTATA